MIISLLASTLLFALFSATEDAKIARARAQIAKINDLVMARWESYRTRAIRLEFRDVNGQLISPRYITTMPEPFEDQPANAGNNVFDPGENYTDSNGNGGYDYGIAWARLHVLRDIMRMEMPDCIEDVSGAPVQNLVVHRTNGNHIMVQANRPALSQEYVRRGNAVTSWTVTHQDSECLYLILASIRDIDGNGLEFLREGEIGDLDEDDMPEVLDPWGRPIAWIRWPAGFLGHSGSDYTAGTSDDIPSYTNLQDGDPARSHDPFDPLKVIRRREAIATYTQPPPGGSVTYQFDFALYPLVCSSGPDEALDIVRFDYQYPDVGTAIPFDYYRTVTNPNGGIKNDPWSIMLKSQRRLGEPFLNSAGYRDNITNHAQGG